MEKNLKQTAWAPANIALIKYWGRKKEALRIPENDSLAICLDQDYTITSVEFLADLNEDEVFLDAKILKDLEKERVVEHLDRIRKMAGKKIFAKVFSKNSFPQASGLASSASGFAALTLAATRALGLKLSEKDLSRLARLGSGSSCRSIPSGFVYWRAGNNDFNSYAYSLYPSTYWDLVILTVIVDKGKKKISSTKGHQLAQKNPFLKARLELVEDHLKIIKKALKNKDFSLLGQIMEAEALSLHSVMLTSKPALFYWQPATLAVMHKIINLREGKRVESYFTIDAGPNVQVICEKGKENFLKGQLEEIKGVERVIINRPARGARLISA